MNHTDFMKQHLTETNQLVIMIDSEESLNNINNYCDEKKLKIESIRIEFASHVSLSDRSKMLEKFSRLLSHIEGLKECILGDVFEESALVNLLKHNTLKKIEKLTFMHWSEEHRSHVSESSTAVAVSPAGPLLLSEHFFNYSLVEYLQHAPFLNSLTILESQHNLTPKKHPELLIELTDKLPHFEFKHRCYPSARGALGEAFLSCKSHYAPVKWDTLLKDYLSHIAEQSKQFTTKPPLTEEKPPPFPRNQFLIITHHLKQLAQHYLAYDVNKPLYGHQLDVIEILHKYCTILLRMDKHRDSTRLGSFWGDNAESDLHISQLNALINPVLTTGLFQYPKEHYYTELGKYSDHLKAEEDASLPGRNGNQGLYNSLKKKKELETAISQAKGALRKIYINKDEIKTGFSEYYSNHSIRERLDECLLDPYNAINALQLRAIGNSLYRSNAKPEREFGILLIGISALLLTGIAAIYFMEAPTLVSVAVEATAALAITVLGVGFFASGTYRKGPIANKIGEVLDKTAKIETQAPIVA